jgi:hypothetical protein
MHKNEPNVAIEALPPLAREIAEVIGIEDTLKLASAANNRHVYVPKTLTGKCRLVEQVGWKIAEKLHAHFKDELLHVPKCWFATLSPEGIEAMREARLKGIGPRLLAKVTGLTESGVRVALNRSARASTPPPGIGSFPRKRGEG